MDRRCEKPETIKLLWESTVENCHGLGLGTDFLDTTPKAQSVKEGKTDKLDFRKIKTSLRIKSFLRPL